MEKTIYENILSDRNKDFTGEEITTFKRYIEENNVYTENNFEYLEENLGYYSCRYTNENYISPFEFFQVNSNYIDSDEIKKNNKLYNASIEWYSKTVHPENSEYVIKEEKYIYISEINKVLSSFIDELNKFPKGDYQCLDLLIYYKGNIYKYLPQKKFVFTWRKGCDKLIKNLVEENFYQDYKMLNDGRYKEPIILLPIFIPIRQMLFLGEYGCRNAIIYYGRIIERIENFIKDKYQYDNIDMFDNIKLNKLIGIDGVEKSIYNIFIFEEREE